MQAIDETIDHLVEIARREGRDVLYEHEAYAMLAELGWQTPAYRFVRDSTDAQVNEVADLGSPRIVVKVVAPSIVHKSDVGGVAVVPATPADAAAAIRKMGTALAGQDVHGYLLCEFVEYDREPGAELLVGLRWTPDFGPTLTLGPGGLFTEFLAGRPEGVCIFSTALPSPRRIEAVLAGKRFVELITEPQRGRPARLDRQALVDRVGEWLRAALLLIPDRILELEINPLVLTERGPVALDAVVTLGHANDEPARPRPLWKLARLLEPHSMAIVGVSRRQNPGRILLENTLADGFPPERLWVVKPGTDSIAGCPCVPDLGSLPEPVDLLVVAVDAENADALLQEAVATRKTESMILIPGGLGEHSESRGLEAAMRRTLEEARATAWGGPVVNGGNCLGIRSRPGRYDTMFIPRHKFPSPEGKVTPLGFVSQSGAFVVATMSKLEWLNPRYLVSIGNQLDLTLADWFEYLKDETEIDVFACYAEGFRPGDGERFLRSAAEITSSGRPLVLYLAGRTPAGARATASHTATIAGDHVVTRELARQAGVLLADSLADFTDLLGTLCQLADKPVRGPRVGALSNAGFECVAIADNPGRLRLEPFGDVCRERLEHLLRDCRLGRIVEVHNPLDVTPIMGDTAFAAAVEALLEDPDTDVGVVGCVPLTGALDTLGDGVSAADGLASRLIRLWGEHAKPWVVVVDAGSPYDPFVLRLQRRGIPVFRSIDRAMRILSRVVDRTSGPDL